MAASCCRSLTRGLRQLAPCARIRQHSPCMQLQPARTWRCLAVHTSSKSSNCSCSCQHAHAYSLCGQQSRFSYLQQQICRIKHLSTSHETYGMEPGQCWVSHKLAIALITAPEYKAKLTLYSRAFSPTMYAANHLLEREREHA